MRIPTSCRPHPGDWVRAQRELLRVEQEYFELLTRASRGEASRDAVREAERALARQREVTTAVVERLGPARGSSERPRS